MHSIAGLRWSSCTRVLEYRYSYLYQHNTGHRSSLPQLGNRGRRSLFTNPQYLPSYRTRVLYLADSKVSGNLGAISHLSPGHSAPRFPNTFESAKYRYHTCSAGPLSGGGCKGMKGVYIYINKTQSPYHT